MDEENDSYVETQKNEGFLVGHPLAAPEHNVTHVFGEAFRNYEQRVHDYEDDETNQAQKMEASSQLSTPKNPGVPGESRAQGWRHRCTSGDHERTKQEHNTCVGQLLKRVVWTAGNRGLPTQ